MSTRRILAALVAAALFAPALSLEAQTGGRRGAVTTRLGAGDPSAAVRVRSVPVATPRGHVRGIADHFGRSGRFGFAHGKFRAPVYVLPYATAFATEPHTATDAAVLEAIGAATEAALDAREAALDAREAALDARDAATGRTGFVSPSARSQATDGSNVLTWKPGGITPARPGDREGSRSRVVVLEPGQAPVIRPAAAPPAPDELRMAATRVRLVLPQVPLTVAGVPWWRANPCASVWQLPVQQSQRDRRRFPWGLGWLYRYGRDVEVERGTVSAPSFHMRSPLLSGLYQRVDCPPGDQVAPTCAEVTLVGDDDAAIAFEVPLPQLLAQTPSALREIIEDGLADGEIVVLRTTDGEEFDLMPGSVREIDAGICRVD